MERYTVPGLNFTLFVIGMIMVWETTHNLFALLWCMVAAAHIEFTKK